MKPVVVLYFSERLEEWESRWGTFVHGLSGLPWESGQRVLAPLLENEPLPCLNLQQSSLNSVPPLPKSCPCENIPRSHQ